MSDETTIQPALNPARGRTRWGERPLSPLEQMQRAAVACANSPQPKCMGQVFVGMFFDGTGNNMKADYDDGKIDVRHQKHSNVVRLFNAHRVKPIAGIGYYRYYVPGLGTPFDEIGDTEKKMQGMTQKLGSAAALYGAARVVWGLTRVFNAISQRIDRKDLLTDSDAATVANEVSQLWAPNLFNKWMRNNQLRGPWMDKLKAKVKGSKIEITQVTVNVFGFSRGSAEARAFVNWLFELCKDQGGAWTFAGIPIQVQFLGLFDTVSSVGVAGLYSLSEGRQGWADDNMQVHLAVQQCLHMAAAHEVRACFPLDSVRIDGGYGPNVIEYLYPGSHSDVGGGYMPLALGKKDFGDNADLQLARVPGYEMYCAARAAGVPFLAPEQLPPKVLAALKPSEATVDAFDAYFKNAAITPGPIEDMARQHMSLYFTHRLAQGDGKARADLKNAKGKPNQGESYAHEPDWMQDTQEALMQVVAGICGEIDKRIAEGGARDEVLRNPFAYTFDAGDAARGYVGWVAGTVVGTLAGAYEGARQAIAMDSYWAAPAAAMGGAQAGGVVGGAGGAAAAYGSRLVLKRIDALKDEASIQKAVQLARQAPQYLQRWRDWLKFGTTAGGGYLQAELQETAVERDAVALLRSLQAKPVSPEIGNFFDNLVHDSMAGFIGFGMPEFQLNGYGIAKFRRIYFGNNGDLILRKRAERANAQSAAAAQARRAQKSKWDAESREFQRTQVKSW